MDAPGVSISEALPAGAGGGAGGSGGVQGGALGAQAHAAGSGPALAQGDQVNKVVYTVSRCTETRTFSPLPPLLAAHSQPAHRVPFPLPKGPPNNVQEGGHAYNTQQLERVHQLHLMRSDVSPGCRNRVL